VPKYPSILFMDYCLIVDRLWINYSENLFLNTKVQISKTYQFRISKKKCYFSCHPVCIKYKPISRVSLWLSSNLDLHFSPYLRMFYVRCSTIPDLKFIFLTVRNTPTWSNLFFLSRPNNKFFNARISGAATRVKHGYSLLENPKSD
jgi:hypothetical protein